MANIKVTKKKRIEAYDMFRSGHNNDYVAKKMKVRSKTIERIRCEWYIEITTKSIRTSNDLVRSTEITDVQIAKQLAFISKYATSQRESILITHKANLKQLHNKLNK